MDESLTCVCPVKPCPLAGCEKESPVFEIRMRRLRFHLLHFTHFIWLLSIFSSFFCGVSGLLLLI